MSSPTDKDICVVEPFTTRETERLAALLALAVWAATHVTLKDKLMVIPKQNEADKLIFATAMGILGGVQVPKDALTMDGDKFALQSAASLAWALNLGKRLTESVCKARGLDDAEIQSQRETAQEIVDGLDDEEGQWKKS